MSASHAFRRFSFTFGAMFAGLYVVAVWKYWALVTVFPTLDLAVLGTQHPQDYAPGIGGLPAMYWYGWMGTAALGALVVGLVAALIPERWTRRIWVGWLWITPTLAMLACVRLTMPWFRR